MHTALDAVRIVVDPHCGVFIHLAAVCVKDVVIVAYLCKAESKNRVVIVVGVTVAAVDKACLNHLAVLVERVPVALFGDKVVLLSNPNSFVNRKLTVSVCVVILAVEGIETVSHLNTVNCKVKLAVLVYNSLLAVDCVGDKHLTVSVKVVHTALDTVRIVVDPHCRVFIHLAAEIVKDVIIVAYLSEAESKNSIIIVVGVTVAAVDKAGLNHLAVLVESVPVALFGNKVVLLSNPNSFVNRKLTVSVCVVILAVEGIETVSHLNTVNCKVKLAVLVYNSLLAVDCVGDIHFSVCVKVVHTALDAVRIVVDPHCSVLIHSACSGIENVIIVADLCEALSVLVVLKIVCLAVYRCEAVGKDSSVGAAPIMAVFEINIALRCSC